MSSRRLRILLCTLLCTLGKFRQLSQIVLPNLHAHYKVGRSQTEAEGWFGTLVEGSSVASSKYSAHNKETLHLQNGIRKGHGECGSWILRFWRCLLTASYKFPDSAVFIFNARKSFTSLMRKQTEKNQLEQKIKIKCDPRDWHVHTVIFKIDKQQGPTVQPGISAQ